MLALRQSSGVFGVVLRTHFAESRVLGVVFNHHLGAVVGGVDIVVGQRFHLNQCGIGTAQRKFVVVNAEFHGVAHRGKLHQFHQSAGNQPHVKKVLTQFAFAANSLYLSRFAYF